MSTIKTLVTYLEMLKQPPNQPAPLPANLRLELVPNIDISSYIQLYQQVGSEYYWTSRLTISAANLAKIIHHPNNKIYILYDADVAIGFFELSARNAPKSVEISFVGLVPTAIGRGYGKLLTEYAIAYAWSQGAEIQRPNRIIIQTCTLDHKRALPLYQLLGFVAYNRHVTEFQTLNS